MNDLKALESAIGKRLNSARYLVHKYNDRITEAIGLTLRFDSEIDLSIRPAANGVALIWQIDPVEEMDLKEYGQIEIVAADAYDPAGATAVIGKSLQSYSLEDAPTGDVWRIELTFDGMKVGICNNDDILTFESCDSAE